MGKKNPQSQASTPAVSVVVVVYNIPREAPRTLYSLSAAYQRDIQARDYEVIVVDNGSDPPFDASVLDTLEGNYRLIRIDDAPKSPAPAINRGLAEARGDVIGVMIDGARIATPGLLNFARHGAGLYDKSVVAALGWYLGADFQRWAMRYGYDQKQEDALLDSIKWPKDGYRLFEIATLDESSVEGWFQPIAEANALFMRRRLWDELKGFDERFDLPGGGLANLDTFERAIELSDARLVVMLGEATFHQIHGGIATNMPVEQQRDGWNLWASQYEQIHGRPYAIPVPKAPPTYVGTLPRGALLHVAHAATAPLRRERKPLGDKFDRSLWTTGRKQAAPDPSAAAAIALIRSEMAAGRRNAAARIARIVRNRFPAEPEPQRVLSLIASAPDQERMTDECYAAVGEAHLLLGDTAQSEQSFRQALKINTNSLRAHIGIANLQMSGDFYYDWLARLYASLSPEFLLEIGVANGASLARVVPPTVAIGVDPQPNISHPLVAETHIFPETSDAFFHGGRLDTILNGRPLGVAFIDGLHLYEQSLRDFINTEKYCERRSVILIHDTVPLDQRTQDRACDTSFHTGDVWKTVLCLKYYRPDLDVFTIATPWTGLTVVANLDPGSRVLSNFYDEAVTRFMEMPFDELARDKSAMLNIVANDWATVHDRLSAAGVF